MADGFPLGFEIELFFTAPHDEINLFRIILNMFLMSQKNSDRRIMEGLTVTCEGEMKNPIHLN